jgi:predicted MFS family arabinose efflux permease
VAATVRLPVRVASLPGRASVVGPGDAVLSGGGAVPEAVPVAAVGIVASLRDPGLARPAVAFCAVAAGGGVVATFLPLALTGSALLAAVALLIQSVVATALRWWAGRYGDRRGPARLLAPSLLVSAAGIGLLALVPHPVAALAGAAVFGAGFGVAQNASMATMFARGSRSGYDAISAMWNIAYDAGLGLGAVGFGLLSVHTGYPWAFVTTALIILPLALLAHRPTRAIPA